MKTSRDVLMDKFKKQYDGNIVKENGKWYWIYEGAKSLISNSWLSMMLRNKLTKEKPTVEIQQHQDEVMVENVGIETPVEKQESENESPALSEEEIKALKNAKRREKRQQRKLEKKKDEQSQ